MWELDSKSADAHSTMSAKKHVAEFDFLKRLCGKAAILHVMPYEDWMSARSQIRFYSLITENVSMPRKVVKAR
jgi:hypothetical protein